MIRRLLLDTVTLLGGVLIGLGLIAASHQPVAGAVVVAAGAACLLLGRHPDA